MKIPELIFEEQLLTTTKGKEIKSMNNEEYQTEILEINQKITELKNECQKPHEESVYVYLMKGSKKSPTLN